MNSWRLKSVFASCLALTSLCATALYAAGPAPAPSSQALFERLRPSVVEVITQNQANLGVTSVASGFVTHRNDWVITNYHAVSHAIWKPSEQSLKVRAQDGDRENAQVVAVDVQTDLAILRVERRIDAPLLTLREDVPPKGEPGYAMGKPGSYVHSIVGGTFNGLLDEETASKIVFSGAINGGMSGGPTLDAQGKVAGINVASSTHHQLVGLAVSAQSLGQLIRRSQNKAVPSLEELRQDIARQLATYGQQLVGRLDLPKHSLRRLGPFRVRGDLVSTMPCGTSSTNKPGHHYKKLEQFCSAGDGLFVTRDQEAGRIRTGAFWLHSERLGALAMSRQVEAELHSLRDVSDEEVPPGRWQCREQRLRGPMDLPLQLHACRRPVENVPGLYDFKFRYTPLVMGPDALVVAVGLAGFDDDTARAVLRKSIESLRYTSEVKP